jgi:hypothetical protein
MIVPGCFFAIYNAIPGTACNLHDRVIYYNGEETYTNDCYWVEPEEDGFVSVCTTYISDLYPVYFEDSMSASAAYVSGRLYKELYDIANEELGASCAIVSGVLTATVSYSTYNNWTNEELGASCAIVSGVLTTTVSYGTYNNWINEELGASCSIVSGVLTVTTGYATYSNYQDESLTASCSIISGVLT